MIDDPIQNLRGEIEKMCAFLGKTLSEEQQQMLIKDLQFADMSVNQIMAIDDDGFAQGDFIRKGKSNKLFIHVIN